MPVLIHIFRRYGIREAPSSAHTKKACLEFWIMTKATARHRSGSLKSRALAEPSQDPGIHNRGCSCSADTNLCALFSECPRVENQYNELREGQSLGQVDAAAASVSGWVATRKYYPLLLLCIRGATAGSLSCLCS